MPHFRSVSLPAGVPGELLLHSLPGRYEPWADSSAELVSRGINRIICVMTEREAMDKSAPYARAAAANELPCARTVIAIREYDVPQDRASFYVLAEEVAAALRKGDRILVHCAAGRGRTGMFAMCVMIALGYSLRQAERAVSRAGSRPENADQKRVVTVMARQGRRGLFAFLRPASR